MRMALMCESGLVADRTARDSGNVPAVAPLPLVRGTGAEDVVVVSMGGRRRRRVKSRAGMPKLGVVIGGGGNGVVHVLADDDTVVCKELKRHSGDGPPRFIREVTVLQSIDHPGVIRVYDSNVATAARDDVLWFTMPRAEPFPDQASTFVPERVALLAQVASTLADLATAGIHHRDIKPSNLLMVNGQPVVADFGLVTTPDDVGDLTAQRPKLGSNFYIPSELINDPGTADGAPADVYSFGKTIWVVLSGRAHPPNQVDGAAALAVLLPGEPRLSEIDALLCAMTAEDPKRRPSMRAVANELEAWLPVGRSEVGREWPDLRAVIQSAKLQDQASDAKFAARKSETDAIRSALYRLVTRCEDTLKYLESQGAPVFRRAGAAAFQYDAGDLLDLVSGPAPHSESSDEPLQIRASVSSLIRGSERQPGLRHFVGVVKDSSDVEAVFVTGTAITYWGGRSVVLQAGARSALIGGPSELAVFGELASAMASRIESDVCFWREAITNPTV
jgi:serine/threonine protein kinase